MRMCRCDGAYRRAHQVLAGIENDGESEGALGQCQADGNDQRTIALGCKNWNQHQEGHHREILKQQDAQGNVAVRQVQLIILGE